MRRSASLSLLLGSGLVAAASLCAPAARAEGSALRADLVDSKAVKLDGIPKEWPAGMTRLAFPVKGRGGKPDLEARALVAYDASNVYVAADVTDDRLRGGADHLALVVGFPGGTTHEVALYPGEPGKSAGGAKIDGAAAPGAKVVEAPREGGWSLEASLPWSIFPEAKAVRVGLRAALFVHDADDSTAVEAVMGTAPSSAYASLPPLSTEAEQALADGLLREKGIRGAPQVNLIADVTGDAMKERVLVFDRWLVVFGPTYRNGSEYYFADLGVDASAGMLSSCEARDVTGDGKAELVLRKRVGDGPRWREIVQVQTFGSSDVPKTIFQHEVGIASEVGSITNEVLFPPDGADKAARAVDVARPSKLAIRIQPGVAKGFDAGNYREPAETAFDGLLLPWGTIKSQTYRYDGSGFAKAGEEKQAATRPPPRPARAPEAAAAAAPPAARPADLTDRVYDAYKRDRGVSGRPRFDLAVDVAGDKQAERVLVHDREIVVFGKGFKGGTGYAFLSMPQLASAADVLDVTARDLTGDGKAEIVVRGVLHASGPREAGGGSVDREVVLVFQMAGDSLRRVFAAETSRTMGRKKIVASLAFVAAGGGKWDLELRADRAVDWTDKTYPFGDDSVSAGGTGGFEPLLLPWGATKSVRYRWDGAAFSR